MSVEQLKSALNIMRRMPPSTTETSLSGLINLVPELTDELLQRIDQPLQLETDKTNGKKFVLCDYNRDGDSYRSPWSNKYFPPIKDGFEPSPDLRQLELEFNLVFDSYRKLYFEGGHSSVYLWDMEGNNFAGCFLIRKDVDKLRGLNSGSWNSIHVVEANEIRSNEYEYKLTTTVIVSMEVKSQEVGVVDLSGNMTKQATKKVKLSADRTHIMNIGQMVEDMELLIRNSIEGVYIQKTKTILTDIRNPNRRAKVNNMFRNNLLSAVAKHGNKRDKHYD